MTLQIDHRPEDRSDHDRMYPVHVKDCDLRDECAGIYRQQKDGGKGRDGRHQNADAAHSLYYDYYGFPDHTAQHELQAYPLMSIPLLPVVSSSHPLATEMRPITRDVLQEHVQLVLTYPFDSSGPSFGIVSSKIWRFVDMGSRLDFLLAGSGWAKFPLHVVEAGLKDGRLLELTVQDTSVAAATVPIFAVHERERKPRMAAQWFVDDLRKRALLRESLATWTDAPQRAVNPLR